MLNGSRVHAVVGESHFLRRQVEARVVAAWPGSVQRVILPEDFERRLLDLATPSLFGDPELLVCQLDDTLLSKHQAPVVELAQQQEPGGVLVLLLDDFLPKTKRGNLAADALHELLAARKAVHLVPMPDEKHIVDWVVEQLLAFGQEVRQPREIAQLCVQHRGHNPDVLANTLELALLSAGDGPLTPELTRQLFTDTAEEPIYVFTNAFCSGDARTCLNLLYAQRGLEPEPLLAAVENELRKLLACLSEDDDRAAWKLAGLKGSPGKGMYYTRKRAQGLGRTCVLRLLDGVISTHASLRRSGTDPSLAVEQLVLQAQRVIR